MRELDATPWPEVADLLAYWSQNPPLHLMVKAYLGFKPKRDDEMITPTQMMQQLQG